MKAKAHITLLLIVLFLTTLAHAQITLIGKVIDATTNRSIEYATVKTFYGKVVVNTDSAGIFTIGLDSLPCYIITSYVGYQIDTTLLTSSEILIKLKATFALKEVTITEKNFSTLHSNFKTINTETIGIGELKKAACCNLSESFETNASVDVTMSDGVSGAKQISMLGLDGVYTQVLLENTPYIRALSSSYGLSFLPGTWIESIDISKGTGSVVNGFEALSGIVNVELQKPDKANKLLVNLYASSASRAEANINYQQKITNKWSYLLMAHNSRVLAKNDFNNDNFIDIPLSNQYNIFNRVKYNGERLLFQAAVQLLDDDKQSGEINFNKQNDYLTTNRYGIGIHNKQGMFYTKTAINFLNKPYRSLGLITNGKQQEQQSFFGLKTYNANYHSFYSNLIFQDIIGDTRHKYKAGATYLYDQYRETYNDSSFSRIDNIPGAFAEYNYDDLEKFSAVVGFRIDAHNKFGNFYTPKLNLKYHINKASTIRFSAGMGTRIANIFMDNTALFANARKVIVFEKPLPEKGYSAGLNFMHNTIINNNNFALIIDVYSSAFSNQVVIDFYNNYKTILVYNLKGKSYANAAQAEVSYNINKFITIKTAYKYYQVISTYNNVEMPKPMFPKNRALLTVSYASKFDIWKIDGSIKYTGKSRLPVSSNYSNPAMHNTQGNSFYTANAQITRAFKKMEIYFGIENITNFLQPNAIVSAAKPFADTFDATMIYGPVTGRIFYAGVRYNVK